MKVFRLSDLALRALLVAAFIACFVGCSDSNEATGEAPRKTRKSSLIADAGAKKAKASKKKSARKGAKAKGKKAKKAARRKAKPLRSVTVVDELASLSETERAKVTILQAALDGNRSSDTLAAARVAAASSEPAVRKAAVDALSCLGGKGLPELTSLMADADAEVAEEAIGKVEDVLMGLENDLEAFALAASYLDTFSSNEDAMRMLSGVMSSSGSQLCEPSDPESVSDVAAALANRQKIAETFSQLLDKGGGNGEIVKETYRDITSSEWVSSAEAAKWAADPDSYEPPESAE